MAIGVSKDYRVGVFNYYTKLGRCLRVLLDEGSCGRSCAENGFWAKLWKDLGFEGQSFTFTLKTRELIMKCLNIYHRIIILSSNKQMSD